MKNTGKFPSSVSGLFAGVLALTLAPSAFCQISPEDKAQVLLKEVKTRALDSQRAAKQKEIERLKEDLEKDRKEADDVKQSIEPMSTAITDANNHLTQLTAKKLQLTQNLEIVALQIDAERLKVEGLKMLSDAQAKGVVALNKRMEETEARSAIEQLKLTPPPSPAANSEAKDAASESKTELELEKKLEKCQRATSTAKGEARDAMTAATLKVQAASAADEKAKQKAAEYGIGNKMDTSSEMDPNSDGLEGSDKGDIAPLKDVDPQKVEMPKAGAALPARPTPK